MHTLTAVFRAPENTEEFDTHYRDVHSPLVRTMEGIRKIETTWVGKMITPSNETLSNSPYLICTMFFDSEEALNTGMRSVGGKAAARDLMSFAGPLVSMVTGTTDEVSL